MNKKRLFPAFLNLFLYFFNQFQYSFCSVRRRGAKEAVTQWVILRRRKRPERVIRKGAQSPLQGF